MPQGKSYYISFLVDCTYSMTSDMQIKERRMTIEEQIVNLNARMCHILSAENTFFTIKHPWQIVLPGMSQRQVLRVSKVRTNEYKCLWLIVFCSLVLWLSSRHTLCHSVPVYALIKRQIAVVFRDLFCSSALHLHHTKS